MKKIIAICTLFALVPLAEAAPSVVARGGGGAVRQVARNFNRLNGGGFRSVARRGFGGRFIGPPVRRGFGFGVRGIRRLGFGGFGFGFNRGFGFGFNRSGFGFNRFGFGGYGVNSLNSLAFGGGYGSAVTSIASYSLAVPYLPVVPFTFFAPVEVGVAGYSTGKVGATTCSCAGP